MKKILILSTVTAATLFATNGANLIGLGVESRALGGTGIAMYHGSENAMTNPALLGKTKSMKKELTIAATYFKADVSAKTTGGMQHQATNDNSDVGSSIIPYISHSHRISNTLTMGFGLYGTGGMGVDYSDNANLYNMKSELQILQLAPSIAYNKDNYGLGLTAIIQYGRLSIDYVNANGHIGDNKMSSDTGFGIAIGGYYDFTNEFSLAATYKSAIDMKYGKEISTASEQFGYGRGPNALEAKSDHLEQPSEIGVGFAFNSGQFTYSADYKIIKWGEAKGYKDFGWEDQKVLALGAKYTISKYWFGLGFNKSNNPIPNNEDPTNVWSGTNTAPSPQQGNTNGDTMNMFNYILFPGTITKAYTFGSGYSLDKDSSIAFAYMYAPEVSDTVNASSVDVGKITTKHTQNALTIAYKFNF